MSKKLNTEKSLFSKSLPLLILIDILILPYFPIFIIPFSLPIVIILNLLTVKQSLREEYFSLFLIVTVMISISILIGLFTYDRSEYLLENLKRGLQLITTFSYFFYYRYILKNIDISFKSVFFVFVIYFTVLSILFMINPNYLVDLKMLIYKSSANRIEDIFYNYRFSYMFTDPNTAGYLYAIVVIFMLYNMNLKLVEKLVTILSVPINLIAIQSNALLLIFLMILGFEIINFIIYKKRVSKTQIITVGISLIIIYTLFAHYKTTITPYLDYFFNRIQNVSSDNKEGRLDRYILTIKNFTPYLWGEGYILLINGNVFKPHSDHFRMIYSYGIIAYLGIMKFFFNNMFKGKRYFFLIPAIVAFSINTLIDEQKLLALFLILLSYNLIVDKKNMLGEKNEKNISV